MNYYEEGAEEEIAWRNEPGMANSVGAILGQLDVGLSSHPFRCTHLWKGQRD